MPMNYERLFQYDDWANREEVTHLRSMRNPPARAITLLAHIVGTEWVWLSRLQRNTPKMAVWPELTIDGIAAELPLLQAAWAEYLSANPSGSIEYRNSKGESWKSAIDDVLTHVAMHSSYHRGQIATVVREGGDQPAYTDYIHCTRIGAI
jgi:uncharacterized damage-inducible protein DinB